MIREFNCYKANGLLLHVWVQILSIVICNCCQHDSNFTRFILLLISFIQWFLNLAWRRLTLCFFPTNEEFQMQMENAVRVYLLWQLSQLSPFWKPAAPFIPGLLPGTIIWLGFGLVLERWAEHSALFWQFCSNPRTWWWSLQCCLLGGDVHLLQLTVCFCCL